MIQEALTGNDNYFEDFSKGAVYKHARGKTVTEMDNVMITNLVMNSAQGHFNEVEMKDSMFGQRVVFGGVTIAMVVGLATQDTGEQAISELGMNNIRLKAPVFHGDTLLAYSEVTEVADSDREDAGIVQFHHWGVNQDDKVVFEGDRRVLIKRRSHWEKQ